MGASLQSRRFRSNQVQKIGRKTPFFSEAVKQDLAHQIQEALKRAALAPQTRKTKPIPRWTLKKLVQWIEGKWQLNCCRETVRKALKKMGFSWKKAKKLLNKASRDAAASPVVVRRRSGHSPCAKREKFIEKITDLLDDALHQRQLLLYIDEAHIHLDSDEGYGWSIRGERFWVSSSSPGRAKVSFYGVYIYNRGSIRILPYEKAEKFNTIDVLKKLRIEFPESAMTIVWDGAPYHRAKIVQEAALALDINLQPLPGYSPDFMPVEHLWQWLREDVTYHACYDSQQDLIDAVVNFQNQINTNPLSISDRLWVKKHLEPDEEKLRVSK